MELHQLRYLLAVAEEGGFTRAAVREHVAQPGISAQVRRLESELGHELLDRSARGVRLTPAGEAVLPHVRAALAAIGAVRETADELSGLLRGRVSLGTVGGGGVVDLPALLGGFHRAHPGVELRLVEDTSPALVQRVQAGDLDLAWVGRPDTLPVDLDSRVVLDTTLVLAVAPAHPLAGCDGVPVADLAGHAVITLPVGAGARIAFDQACARAGVALHPGLQAGTPTVLVDLAAQGLGVAVVPAPAVAGRHDVRRVAMDPPVRACVDLVWRRAGSGGPAVQAMLTHATAASGQSPYEGAGASWSAL